MWADLADQIVSVGSGRLGLANRGLTAFAMGCDLIGVGREAMLAANYIAAIRQDLLRLARACGHPHPSMVRPDQIEFLSDGQRSLSLAEILPYGPEHSVPSVAHLDELATSWPTPATRSV